MLAVALGTSYCGRSRCRTRHNRQVDQATRELLPDITDTKWCQYPPSQSVQMNDALASYIGGPVSPFAPATNQQHWEKLVNRRVSMCFALWYISAVCRCLRVVAQRNKYPGFTATDNLFQRVRLVVVLSSNAERRSGPDYHCVKHAMRSHRVPAHIDKANTTTLPHGSPIQSLPAPPSPDPSTAPYQYSLPRVIMCCRRQRNYRVS
ncbi:hypothetical protein CBL_11439 [Carabus blaptoides fortunei]